MDVKWKMLHVNRWLFCVMWRFIYSSQPLVQQTGPFLYKIIYNDESQVAECDVVFNNSVCFRDGLCSSDSSRYASSALIAVISVCPGLYCTKWKKADASLSACVCVCDDCIVDAEQDGWGVQLQTHLFFFLCVRVLYSHCSFCVHTRTHAQIQTIAQHLPCLVHILPHLESNFLYWFRWERVTFITMK